MLLLIGASFSLTCWIGLLLARGAFWRCDPWLPRPTAAQPGAWPAVCALIPARNEAAVLPETLPSLLRQDYPGALHILLIDDGSGDGTALTARRIANVETAACRLLTVLEGSPLPPGWTGKLWALEQGFRHASSAPADFWLLTDADIWHDPGNIRQLVTKALAENLDVVSLMVALRCQSFWERLLMPPFVFFFQKLYPFRWVANPASATAAAAGGCMLVRRAALERAGGLEAIRGELIDDCALARVVKASGGKLWLGHSRTTRSQRAYPALEDVWNMVARTAFTQLRYSPWLLAGTVFSMALLYLAPPVALVAGIVLRDWKAAAAGGLAWLLMALLFTPTLKLYRQPVFLAFALPFAAALYTAMTADSALRHWLGKGGAWKGRTYGKA